MLTLDETTLYYWSLNSPDESHKKGLITDWTSSVNSFAPSQNPKNKSIAKSTNSRVPSLTNASTRSSSKSVLTDTVMITADRKNSRQSAQEPNVKISGGLPDEDETNGEERDVAISSPVKGKVRLTSTVVDISSTCVEYVQELTGFSLGDHQARGHSESCQKDQWPPEWREMAHFRSS